MTSLQLAQHIAALVSKLQHEGGCVSRIGVEFPPTQSVVSSTAYCGFQSEGRQFFVEIKEV